MEDRTTEEWARAAVRTLLDRCMRVLALQLECRAAGLRIELARRGSR